MSDETPSAEDIAVLWDLVMLLADSLVMAEKPSVLKRWRKACEWLIKTRPGKPAIRARSAVLARGLFSVGRRMKSASLTGP